MDWKQSLDRYLTTEPEDNFTPWVEKVFDNYTPKFWTEVYDVPVKTKNRFEDSEHETKWLNKLFNKETDPILAAKIIERAYKMFINYPFKRKRFPFKRGIKGDL